jgi:hypothetical protein
VWSVSVFGQVNWVRPNPGSRPTWYLTHEYVGRNLACDLQELQVAPLTVPLFLEGFLSYSWDRTRLDGRHGAAIWCGHGVFTHNLVKIAALAS